ncbi:MAG: 4a-hydroxytetrahydrobiopterin dehydratase [Chlorobi bacterium]|nr:MAG: 4a-hydroxytetrahydrobiopterin dehydratase [Bacteroidota bacterium]KXK34661.1 MAG: 4a-hydroxytetrahydrobiopterin dehydratase [Chlorobi bacterium OLB6]MBL1160964.1 4a-hydroxytetrahydrobiopterin dehydratase [Chlorobiota bacterium]MBW7852922.1 4a-hydroxytetrahydrobiopterin dehydratase [Candidatus Kapabacteria bacterium]MCC6330826.1 4a-hydroxytetrahydrobiopterin dehydratase [Ignavibacteria bacterium]
MTRPTLLPGNELSEHLKDIPMWRLEGATIVREMPASDFAAAMGLVNAVALLAEKADHHPDILLYGWNKVRITLSTHDQGGITMADIRLAKAIDALKFNIV